MGIGAAVDAEGISLGEARQIFDVEEIIVHPFYSDAAAFAGTEWSETVVRAWPAFDLAFLLLDGEVEGVSPPTLRDWSAVAGPETGRAECTEA